MGRTSDYAKQVLDKDFEYSVESKKKTKNFNDIEKMFAKKTNDSRTIWNILGRT